MSEPKESEEQVRGTDWSVYFIPIATIALVVAMIFPFAKGFFGAMRRTPNPEVKVSEQSSIPIDIPVAANDASVRDALFHRMAKEGKSADQISQELDISFRGVIEKMKRHGYISKAEYESLRKGG